MRVAELINELKKCKPDARLNIFIPYEVGEDDKRDIFVSDFKIVEQNKQEVEIYSNDDLKPYYEKHLGKQDTIDELKKENQDAINEGVYLRNENEGYLEEIKGLQKELKDVRNAKP